jgi:hypothetical protein
MLAAVVAKLKRPLIFKNLRSRYNVQRRDKLAISILDQRSCCKVLEHYAFLTKQREDIEEAIENAIDESDEDGIEALEDEWDDVDKERDDTLTIFLGIACEETFEHDPLLKRNVTIEGDVIEGDVSSTFRFRNKPDLRKVMDSLKIPAICGPFKGGVGKTGCYKNREELFLFYLTRICSPSDSLRKICKNGNFGGEYTVWSRAFKWMATWLQTRWGYKIYGNLQFFESRLDMYAEKIRVKAMAVSQTFANRPRPLPPIQFAQDDFSICVHPHR